MSVTPTGSTWNAARLARAYVRLIEFVGIFGIAFVTFIAILQVFFRYVVGASLFWSEELMRYAMIWIVFLVAGLAYNRGEMLGAELAVNLLPPRWRRAVDLVGRAAIVVLLLVLAWYGTIISLQAAVSTAPALDVPMGYLHAAIPVGSILLALHVIAGHYIVRDPTPDNIHGHG
jgi:TRAP-type C4-dicarboxylate transport system permease small subunit